MWNKQQIQMLKQEAYSFSENEGIRDHISLLNAHLNNYEKKPLFHEKNRLWRLAEQEADLIRNMLNSLQVGHHQSAA